MCVAALLYIVWMKIVLHTLNVSYAWMALPQLFSQIASYGQLFFYIVCQVLHYQSHL